MAEPVLLTVDDDRPVLAAIRRDLLRRYAPEYRVVAAGGGPEALEVVRELKLRGEDVALFLVDQRMPVMTGTEFLLAAREIYPAAKRVLLTAYADTEAAIAAINRVGLDHYLLKPWDPPEDLLYPVLDDLLEDWRAGRRSVFEGIRVIGLRWSPLTYEVKDFLALNQVPYRFLDVERDVDGRSLLESIGPHTELPAVVLPDGEVLPNPTRRALAERVGLQVSPTDTLYDLVIVGAGPAGLAAAVYGASEGLRVAVVERRATGGQAGTSSRIENYLGFPNGISGSDLARRASSQARKFGAEILTTAEAVATRFDDPVRTVILADGSELTGRALLIASGMTVRKLDVPGYERFTGAGVYYGATVSEAAAYRDEHVFVVGGANSAGQAAMMFSRFASRVSLIVRADTLSARMSRYLVDQIEATPAIEVITGAEVVEVSGRERLEEVTIEGKHSGERITLPAGGLFLFVGAVPHTGFVAGAITLNPQGFIPTGPDLVSDGGSVPGWSRDRPPFLLEASVPGVFAAGDVRHGAVRRVASAVGEGSVSISFVHRYLETA